MNWNRLKEILEAWSTPYIQHDDYQNCGQCWREMIKSEVCKEMLATGKEIELVHVMDEIDKRWKETSLYKRVQDLKEKGLSIEQAGEMLEKEGIII